MESPCKFPSMPCVPSIVPLLMEPQFGSLYNSSKVLAMVYHHLNPFDLPSMMFLWVHSNEWLWTTFVGKGATPLCVFGCKLTLLPNGVLYLVVASETIHIDGCKLPSFEGLWSHSSGWVLLICVFQMHPKVSCREITDFNYAHIQVLPFHYIYDPYTHIIPC